jgi:predicted nucleic acid-binding protein
MWYCRRSRSCLTTLAPRNGTPASARLAHLTQPPAFADGQIAAIAAVRGLTLVTANTADFAKFNNLAVENWLID